MNLTLQEQETALTMTADNRGTWNLYSDDPVLQRRLEAIGATLVKQSTDGTSKWYTLPANQITFRNPKKPLSAEQKERMAIQLAKGRATQRTALAATGAKQANSALQEEES